jgi:hypothetical protein
MATNGSRKATRPSHRESGQGTVEWVGLIGLVALLMVAMLAGGARFPFSSLAGTLADKLICAASIGDNCEPSELVAAYGDDLAGLVRRHTPSIAYEDGMAALPVDYRKCRVTECADGPAEGALTSSFEGQPVTEFVHVIDCRPEAVEETEAAGADCTGDRSGNLYLQYWTYYANSRSWDGVPVAEDLGFHEDDWEGVQVRVNADGSADERASSHNGYNYERSVANWGSDIGWGPAEDVADEIQDVAGQVDLPIDSPVHIAGRRPGGWGPETGWLFVSGGSHAGNAKSPLGEIHRTTPHGGISLVPLEPIADGHPGRIHAFGKISPPWRKDVWSDPEADGTS